MGTSHLTKIKLVTLGTVAMALLMSAARAEIQVAVPDAAPAAKAPAPALAVPKPVDAPAAAVAVGGGPISDVLQFMNRDKLHGELLGVGADLQLNWRHESASDKIGFSLAAISGVQLSSRQVKGNATGTQAAVQLTNGDELRGQIVSLNADQLILDTWYAGRMNIERPMLKTIRPNAAVGTLVYSGPHDIANWTRGRHSSRGSWQFKKGAFVTSQSSSPIGKSIENMPDMARIDFTAAWQGYPSFYFAFYTDNLERYYGNCYMLQISGSSATLQRYTRNGSSSNLGNISVPKFNNRTSGTARFALLVNKKKRMIALMLDGTVIKTWEDAATFAGMGSGILFQSQSSNRLKISNISVAEWDGEVPQQVASGEEETKADLVRFANRDKVSGKLTSIENGNVKFGTTYATMDIPIARVAEFVLSSEQSERARRNKNDVKCSFASDGVITLGLKEISGGQIKGQSENFGDLASPLAAFKHLEFNIYVEKDDEDDEDDF